MDNKMCRWWKRISIKGKFKLFGYVDLVTSSVQIKVAALTTILKMYDTLNETGSGWFSAYIWTLVYVVITALYVGISLLQIQSARQLIQGGVQDFGMAAMLTIRENWVCRNMVTGFAVVVWFACFGIPAYWRHGWYISVVVALFFGIAGIRGVIHWLIRGIKFEEEKDYPNLPPDLMQELMEMQRAGPQPTPICGAEKV